VDSPYYAPLHRDSKGAKLAVWLSYDPDAPSNPPLVLYLQHDAKAKPYLLELDLRSSNYIEAGLVLQAPVGSRISAQSVRELRRQWLGLADSPLSVDAALVVEGMALSWHSGADIWERRLNHPTGYVIARGSIRLIIHSDSATLKPWTTTCGESCTATFAKMPKHGSVGAAKHSGRMTHFGSSPVATSACCGAAFLVRQSILAANGLTLALELERWTLNGTIGHCLEDARERRLDLLRGSSFGLLPRRSKCSNPGTSPCLLNEPTTPDSPDFDPEHAQPILKLHLPSCPRPPARRPLPNANRASPLSASRSIPFSACRTRSSSTAKII
jgi:hypothetical protein